MNKILSVLGRLLWSIPFVLFGLGHFNNASQMAGMVPSFVPGGVVWVYVTGAAMLLAAIAINIRKLDRLAALLAALLLITIALTVQLPNLNNPDATMKMMAFMGLVKDLGLAGGALVIAASSKEG